MKTISIIVPCYNENETINIYYNETIKYLNIDNYKFNFIFVNDGSSDNTLDIIRELEKNDDRIKYISFSRNFGKEAALYAGLEAAKKLGSDAAIQMDVDLQDDPKIIPDMIKEYENGYNLIITRHKNRHGQSFIKSFFSTTYYKLYSFVTKSKNLAKGARDYSLLDKKVIDAFLSIKDYERFTKGMYNFVGFRTKMIEFDYNKRVAGTTKWSFKKLFHYGIMGMREFSRFYEYIPKIFGWIFFLLLIFDTVWQTYNHIANATEFNYRILIFDLSMVMIFITLFYITRLIYDNKKQLQNRPIYITEDTNIKED